MEEKLKDKKVVYTIIGIISLLLILIGITYAYWLVTKTQTNSNVISSACLDITLSNEANDISLTNQFPISDEEGMSLIPYTFTVTNNCSTSVDYQVNLESIGDEVNAIKASALKVALDKNASKRLYEYVGVETTVSGAYEAYILGYGTLAEASEETEEDKASHELRIWIDKDAPISEMNKTFISKITVTVGQGISSQGNTLASLILEDAEENGYLYTNAPNFSNATVAGEYGLYSAEDDLGTSYYYRGDTENNLVGLGTMYEEGFKGVCIYGNCYYDSDGIALDYDSVDACIADIENGAPFTADDCVEVSYEGGYVSIYWRIVRINGDGTIRLIYNGIKNITNDGFYKINPIEKTLYNPTTVDKTIWGKYTYKDNGIEKDSTIKRALDTWYENNIENDYGKYVADSIFCNDQSDVNGDGYFDAYDRLFTNKVPKLTCTRDEDKYTVSPSLGNGLLSKPVGLLTADEALMSGGWLYGNGYTYLREGSTVTMTQAGYSETWPGMFEISGGRHSITYAKDYKYVIPVINLKADVKFTGDGTMDNPYQIVME